MFITSLAIIFSSRFNIVLYANISSFFISASSCVFNISTSLGVIAIFLLLLLSLWLVGLIVKLFKVLLFFILLLIAVVNEFKESTSAFESVGFLPYLEIRFFNLSCCSSASVIWSCNIFFDSCRAVSCILLFSLSIPAFSADKISFKNSINLLFLLL